MLGMDFICFLILLVISVVASAVLHFALKLYVVPGAASFLSKIVLGWIGAWLGSPVLGHWWEGLSYGGIYFVPAILGAVAAGAKGGGYNTASRAAAAMARLKPEYFRPNKAAHAKYQRLYSRYEELAGIFGRGGTDLMLQLKQMQTAEAEEKLAAAKK